MAKNTYISPVDAPAISDPRVHSGHLKYALDFLVPEGTEVFAACDGKIVSVKTDSNQGGFEKKYLGNKYLNSITIKHENGENSQYAHLKFEGACVKEGQHVKAGELIGYSGNTGFTTEPHLHFHVYVDTDSGWETIEIRFKDK